MSLEEYPICVRCGKPVTVLRDFYEQQERMHWLCFHLAFEHNTDPDVACDDPSCPWQVYDAIRALGAMKTADGNGYIIRADLQSPDIDGDTLAAALITLAKKVNDAT